MIILFEEIERERESEKFILELRMSEDERFKFEWQQWQDDLLGITENAVFPIHVDKENYQPRTLVDQTLEIIDPTPNIHTLFVQFNGKYFWNALQSVEVKWSSRMTSCAGTCTFRTRNGECVIALSAPLLKLRPRKDLVETLLHEMIHAYLFLTNNNRDRDGHGPEFCKHMQRINSNAGTNITIYHNFHDEVRLYQQHWWKCNGPCKNRGPYFGTVRRSMNRAPGPSDRWYSEHQRSCGGTFIKIREPEKTKSVNRSKDNDYNKKLSIVPKKSSHTGGDQTNKNGTLDAWLSPGRNNQANDKSSMLVNLGTSSNSIYGFGTGGPATSNSGDSKVSGKTSPNFTKLGTRVNNVYGWGTGGPGSNSTFRSENDKTMTTPNSRFRSVGTVGGSYSGRSCLLEKFQSPSKSVDDVDPPKAKRPKLTNCDKNSQECPVCQDKFSADLINDHLDECLNKNADNINRIESPKERPQTVQCPLCFNEIETNLLSEHADLCIFGQQSTSTSAPKSGQYKCLICEKNISSDIPLEQHLELCVKITYNDSDSSDIESEGSLKPDKNERLSTIREFPCPICMQLFPENAMNDHLDNCLKIS